MQRTTRVEAEYHEGRRHQSLVEVVAAIGYRFASRRILINQLPEGATLKFLQEDMTRFGDVEAVGYKSPRNMKELASGGAAHQGPKRGWVQFCSVKSAMLALKTLRMEQGEGGPTGINFDVENCDWQLKRQYKQMFAMKRQKLQSSEYFRAVRLTKYEEPMSIPRTVMPLLRNTNLPDRGEAVLSIKKGFTQKQSPAITVEFLRPEDALVFWNTCNEEAEKTGKGKAVLKAVEPDHVTFHNARAVALGATRTIGIYNISNWEGLTREAIQYHFSLFGPVYQTQVNEKGRCAFVKYCNMDGAMAAIDRIWLKDCTFHEPYDGAMINFAADTRLGNSRVGLAPLYVKGVPNWVSKSEFS
ncbi:hypothetical protein AAF712_004767 [Marasmius tenuissimus]|uniref:RRM domain-containing protein n=1 Tax=Marasmius tenuissimus TaxID=585030 RepID=A0ABR3A3Z7_9AGAR